MPVAEAPLHALLRSLLTGREGLPAPREQTDVESWLWSFSSRVVAPLLSGDRAEQKESYGKIRTAYRD